MSKITLKHVAENVGVSVNTVSMVLQGRARDGRISPERETQITEAARRLGYLPNAAARAARTGRLGNIALIASTDMERSFASPALLNSIHDALAAVDQHLLYIRLNDTQLTDQTYVPRIARELAADGIILNYTHREPKVLDTLIRRSQVPCIWLNRRRDRDCVFPDDAAISQRATQELLALGHRRIAYVDVTVSLNELPTAHYSRSDREAGYRRAMDEAGLKPQVIRPARRTIGPAMSAYIGDHLQAPDRPTALLSYASRHADLALLAAERLGLSVPDDLSIAGFDSTSHHFDGRSVATVMLPDQHLGQAAVQLIMRKISEPTRPLPPLAVGEAYINLQDTVARVGPKT